MKTVNILCTLVCTMLLAVLPAAAQNTNDDKNKAIIETTEGSQELNTDEVSVIRFNGGKVTVVQPSGETTFDRTLRSLSFQRPNPGTLRLTATTSIGTEGTGNRAQTIDEGGKLKTTWESGDKVYVYATENGTTSIGTLTPKEADWGEKSATLTGDINADGLTDGVTTLYFSTKDRATLDLSTQDGTVGSLFYFTATGTITINGANASVSNLSFKRPIAIVKFTLKDKTDATISAKLFTVNDGTNTYTVTPTAATNELFVGIPAITSQTVTLTATDGNDYYLYQKTGVTFANNEYYGINVKMQASDLARPLTFEAKTEGNIAIENPKSGMQYSLNGGPKTQVPTSISVSVGDKVQFYGHGTSITSYDGTHIAGGSAECYVYGNIMSLVDEGSYATNITLTGDDTFNGLFAGNTNIYNHADKALLLPATTLTDGCYKSMFQGCTNLTTAPTLPATTLVKDCYAGMFQGCTSLNSVTCLATDISAEGCTTNWLDDVAATGMFFKSESMKNWTTGASGIPSGWTAMSYEMMHTPLTFEANEVGATVSFTSTLETPPTVEYSKNGGAWTTYTEPIELTNVGDKVSFRGNNATYATNDRNSKFSCSADCYVYGNIMSLVSSTGFATATELTAAYTFCELFCDGNNSKHIKNHSTKSLCLPATTLTNDCYNSMFSGCTSLTTAPALPATTLAEDCYACMFIDCTSLTTAPALPATTMAEECYSGMFQGCTSLTTAPALPATTLAEDCYSFMFWNCTNLTTAPALPATTLADGCYSSMFFNCKGLTTAPALPATTLVKDCYKTMFQYCTKLNNVTCLATDISAEGCTTDWLEEVAATGTFTKAPDANWTTGANGIPSGWTTKNYMLATPLTFEAKEVGATVSFVCRFTGNFTLPEIEYSYDGMNWTTYTEPITLTNVGDKVSFRGNNASYNDYKFSCSDASCYIYGNIMSLVSKENYAIATNLTEIKVFSSLFAGNDKIYSHSSYELVLPATTLTESCYEEMFHSCTSLTAAPALPATTLADGCYKDMFWNCTSLTAAPVLPATTLAEECYNGMFQNCTNLTTAPALPATSLANDCYSSMFADCKNLTTAPALPATTMKHNCYSGMFNGCTNLSAAPALPATTLADGCYGYMFSGCTSLTAAPALLATTLADGCYEGMFSHCEALTTAPVLPATTLVKDCYKTMFQNCENLNSVTCLATYIWATDCTWNWLSGVAASGTFTKAASMNSWDEGASGIPSGWTAMSYEMMHTPLTFEAKEAGATVSFVCRFTGNFTLPEIEYSYDGMNWTTYTEPITLTNVGDKVSFRGNNASYYAFKFSCSDASCYIYGNIMSLVSKENYATATNLTEIKAFISLFKNNEKICSHSSNELVLPATTLTESCYEEMFLGCTGLTTAPALPATSLATKCYYDMFNGCTSLTAAPDLPATSLANGCYSGMFNDCTNLTSAPALPATSLANGCYSSMFSGCKSLTSAPALPAEILKDNCYQTMFSLCSNLTTAPALPATTLADGCYEAMFFRCSSLTTAPVLPAETLVDFCYYGMFQYCEKLNSVTCLATDIGATDCTRDWLKSVAASGTFTKAASADWNGMIGDNGIPSGWNVVDAQ